MAEDVVNNNHKQSAEEAGSVDLDNQDTLPEEVGLSDYVDIRYLSPEECQFSATAGGFVQLTLADGQNYPRVNLHRAFPLSWPDQFISVRDMEGEEIGLISNLDAFPKEAVALINEELERRYFTPVITKIENIKEEFGYAYWDVETDVGKRRFTVRDMHSNVIPLSDQRVYIIDVDGNRFDIPNLAFLGPKSRKFIEDLF